MAAGDNSKGPLGIDPMRLGSQLGVVGLLWVFNRYLHLDTGLVHDLQGSRWAVYHPTFFSLLAIAMVLQESLVPGRLMRRWAYRLLIWAAAGYLAGLVAYIVAPLEIGEPGILIHSLTHPPWAFLVYLVIPLGTGSWVIGIAAGFLASVMQFLIRRTAGT